MSNAIILHGGPSREEYYDPKLPSASNSHWLPWLQQQLLVHDIAVVTPEIPLAFDRVWPRWQKEVERFDITPQTMLVGHSTGAGFWIKYLSIHPDLRVGKVVLVAPWIDPFHERTKDFFDDFEIAADLVARTGGVTVFYSDDDAADILKTVEILQERLPDATFRQFHGYGHFCYENMHTVEFPELLTELLPVV